MTYNKESGTITSRTATMVSTYNPFYIFDSGSREEPWMYIMDTTKYST